MTLTTTINYCWHLLLLLLESANSYNKATHKTTTHGHNGTLASWTWLDSSGAAWGWAASLSVCVCECTLWPRTRQQQQQQQLPPHRLLLLSSPVSITRRWLSCPCQPRSMYSFPKGITYVRSGHNKFLRWKCQLGADFVVTPAATAPATAPAPTAAPARAEREKSNWLAFVFGASEIELYQLPKKKKKQNKYRNQ